MNPYADVIEVVSSDQDWKAIVVEIAKRHPKAVVDAYRAVNGGWELEAIKLMKGGRKIDAIKLCRSETGLDLLGAKAAVERLN